MEEQFICRKCKEPKTRAEMIADKRVKSGVKRQCKACRRVGRRAGKARDANWIQLETNDFCCKNCMLFKPKDKMVPDKNHKHGVRRMCRECWNLDARKPQRIATAIKYKIDHKEEAFATRISYKFNLSIEHYNELLAQQNNKCAICRIDFTQDNVPCIDHDHNCCSVQLRSCGLCIRGLLCDDCNIALGKLKEDTTALRTAISYLEGEYPFAETRRRSTHAISYRRMAARVGIRRALSELYDNVCYSQSRPVWVGKLARHDCQDTSILCRVSATK